MKVLYINYILQKGHINFDHIQIDALLAQQQDVQIVLHRSIAIQLPYPTCQYALVIPSILGRNSSYALINRLLYLLTLIYLRIKIPFNNYNKVILSSMDEITLGLMPLCRNMHIICHDNGRNIGNGLKGFFLKKLSKRNSFIIFNQEMSIPFKNCGMKNYIISHGCVPPFPKLSKSLIPFDITPFKTIIFHPSNRPSTDFIKELKEDDTFHDFLSRNNILLILRDIIPQENISSNIVYINQYLECASYQSLFLLSDIILLAYPDDFKIRVSGVSFECVANNKRLLFKDNPALRYCLDFYNYNPTFTTITQLKERITFLCKHPDVHCIVKPEDLRPNYSQILSQ